MGAQHSSSSQITRPNTTIREAFGVLQAFPQSKTIYLRITDFSDELLVEILTYISHGPLEISENPNSSLTHVIPCISRRFNFICNSNSNHHHSRILWLPPLQRLIADDPSRWKAGLLSMLNVNHKSPPWSSFYNPALDKNDFMLADEVRKLDNDTEKNNRRNYIHDLVEKVYISIVSQRRNDWSTADDVWYGSETCPNLRIVTAKDLYLNLVRNHALTTLPVIHNHHNITHRVPNTVSFLRFVDQRYCQVLRNLVNESHVKRNGEFLVNSKPRFLLTNKKLSRGVTAFVVEITRCKQLKGGKVDIVIRLIKEVEILTLTQSGIVLDAPFHQATIKRF